jgi:hypothetical protein
MSSADVAALVEAAAAVEAEAAALLDTAAGGGGGGLASLPALQAAESALARPTRGAASQPRRRGAGGEDSGSEPGPSPALLLARLPAPMGQVLSGVLGVWSRLSQLRASR